VSSDPQLYDARLAEHFERLTEVRGDPVGDWLRSALTVGDGSALDLGCGTGRHATILAEHFDQVTAVDLSAAMIARARPAANVAYRAASLFDVTGTYDLVFSSAMLHHVIPVEPALAHIRSLVAPGGRAWLADVTAARSPVVRFGHRWLPRTVYRVSAVLNHRDNYRLSTYKPWLDHVTSDRFLTVEQFRATYGAAFPDAAFVDLGFMLVCAWNQPPVRS
jgi:SAM-dependent methyltransferase